MIIIYNSIIGCTFVLISTAAFLDNPFPLDANLEVSCNNNGKLLGWSWSPDGTENTAVMLNASAKYTISASGTTLHINDVNSTDEGLYRCVYEGGLVPQKCVYVYGESVHFTLV